MGAKPSVEIQHLRTSDDDGLERPIETQRLFVAEIGPVCGTLQGEDARRRDRLRLPWLSIPALPPLATTFCSDPSLGRKQ